MRSFVARKRKVGNTLIKKYVQFVQNNYKVNRIMQ